MLTALYFTAIVLMAGLSGWLSFYAWRQHSLPGARAYSVLALGECLLALSEILSMLSPGPALALFWFNARYSFSAILPVLFLLFALQYNGQKSWLSRRLIAVAFFIPLITQVILWGNLLPGLWVQHEVSFYQSGPFWLSDTNTRIPGLWFMVHSIYSLLVLSVGMVAILISAWAMKRTLLGQALLLSTGALVALVTALIPIFGLIPPGGINPYLPGLGVSELLYALAIFRFQFLKRAPAAERAPPKNLLDIQSRPALAFFLFIFVLFMTGISAVGYQTYHNYEHQFRLQAESQLTNIAKLKIGELQNWRSERLEDGGVFYNNSTFSALVQRFLDDPSDTQAQAEIQTWMNVFKDNKQYDRVYLLDAHGVERIPSSNLPAPVPTHLNQDLAPALKASQITFLDFHRDTPNGPIHLALLVPILANQDQQPLGLLVMQIDPQVYLYPLLRLWPVPSASAETLLVRRDGADELFLNPLRFQADTALNTRISLANTQVLSVKAVLGQTGIVEGVDYRGAAAIGDVRAVPGTPWFLVARINTAEIYAPLQDRLWQMLGLMGALIIAGGAGLGFLGRQQQLRAYQARYQAAEALEESEEKFRKAFRLIPDAMVIARQSDGRILSVNQSFCDLMGYSEAEVIGKSSLELRIWADPQDRAKIIAALRAKGMVENYEALFRTTKDELRNGLLSAVVAELNGEPHVIYSVRDVSELKKFEAELRLGNQYLQALQETTLELLTQLDPNTLIENIIRRAGMLMGTSSGCLYLVEADTGLLTLRIGVGALSEKLPSAFNPRAGIIGTVWQTGQPLVVNDYDHWSGRIPSYPPGTLAAVVNVPLLSNGQILGVLGLGHEFSSQRTFEPKEVEILSQFARLAAIAINNARLFSLVQEELAQRKQQEAQRLAVQVELERMLAKSDQSRHVLLSVIEDQKLAQEKVRELNTNLERRVAERTAQLSTSNKELEAFAYSVSHDLRAPLRAIDGFSRILQQEYAQQLDGEGLRLLGVVRDSTKQMDHLITDLLALSRVSRSELRCSAIDMTALVHSVYNELATPELKEKFEFRAANLPCADGDPTLMRQVWANLISNAIKYTLPKAEYSIEINGSQNDGFNTYSIKDNGVGFNPKYTQKLFGLFQRLHKSGEFEGTGVGLAIVQRIIQRHGGQVWGEGQIGLGATFYFTLPERQAKHV